MREIYRTKNEVSDSVIHIIVSRFCCYSVSFVFLELAFVDCNL